MYVLWDSNWGAPGKNKWGALEERREALLGRTSRMSLVRAREVPPTQHLAVVHDQEAAGMAMSVLLVV